MAAPYFNLGSYRRPITTTHDDCQAWFDRGLIWAYAFNHEESATCFERALAADPDCAMAHWGLTYCIGPNYNKPWSFFDADDLANVVAKGHRAAKLAEANVSRTTPVEKALVRAVQHRYPQEKPADSCEHWNQGFADAMEEVYKEFPDDLDVVTLFVDAVMNLHPWQMWNLQSGNSGSGLSIDGGLEHPGLLHLYIHLMEMSPSPESALPVADRLRGLVPDAGHLHHMPTHLDVLCGRYQEAIASNSDAIAADERYLAKAGPLNFYTLYRSHDYHFRAYAAMFAGQLGVALDTVASLESSIPKNLLQVKSPPMADWLEAFLTLRAHVLIRFGKWEDIIELGVPDDQQLYCVTTAITYYAKGVAFAATGRTEQAEEHRALFHSAVKRVPESRTLFNNTCLDILRIADAMLDGELEYRKGHFEAAYEHLRTAIHREDNLPYDEPWGWMQPTRHAYGALLLEQGLLEQALGVYQADLGMVSILPRALQHPNNVWALHGVHECLGRLGRGAEAEEVEGKLAAAMAVADVPIRASCYCRLETSADCTAGSACQKSL